MAVQGRADACRPTRAPHAAHGSSRHSDFKTTQGYIDLAGETFREEAELADERLFGAVGRPVVPSGGPSSRQAAERSLFKPSTDGRASFAHVSTPGFGASTHVERISIRRSTDSFVDSTEYVTYSDATCVGSVGCFSGVLSLAFG
jgi:hypothetical protein